MGFGAFWCRFSRFALLNLAAAPSFRPVRPRIVAAPIAYEQPTLNKAWEAFVDHIPTILIIWIATAIFLALSYGAQLVMTVVGNSLSGVSLGTGIDGSSPSFLGMILGQLGQLPFSILSNLVYVLFGAVPAMYYATGETITVDRAFQTLLNRPWRYLLAGLLFIAASGIGLLACILPGIAVALVTPVYVNKIFTTDMPILDAFGSSFQSVYRSENGWTFVGIELLAGLVVVVVSFCTCGVGLFVAPAVGSFYVQNAAYRQGVLT